jgi:hypothetical protein
MDINKATFTIFGEVEGHDRPLIMTRLSFARIIDDIVVPFETEKPFFMDGVPVVKEKIRKIKIIRETAELRNFLEGLHIRLRQGTPQEQKDVAEQYDIRVEAILREGGEDVTSQVIKAFDITIRPKLKDYLPNRLELIQAAMLVFAEALKVLGSRIG